ncbi:ABC transporter substrate-binding protein [Patescibacteria group bacterium]|nr:ABC transporter substrate-binding protein [Patescibacteria group bacterium]
MKRANQESNKYILLFILLWVILLSGCSKEPSRLEKASLRIHWTAQTQFAGYYVALDRGWYRDEGIDLTIHTGGPDIDAVEMISTGEDDFATGWFTTLLGARDRGLPVINIAQIFQRSGLVFIAKKDSGIKGPKDFVGKTLGVWEGYENRLKALLGKVNIDPDNVEIVTQKWSMVPFIEGVLDVASAMTYNEYLILLQSGFSKEDLNVISYVDYGINIPEDGIFVTEKTLKEKRDVCVAFVRASIKGWNYALKHPQEAVEILMKHDIELNREQQLSMLEEVAKLINCEATITKGIGYLDPETLNSVGEFLYLYGQLKGMPDIEKAYTHEIWQEAQGGQER